jgi:predicted CXXCH cytochrome family protein
VTSRDAAVAGLPPVARGEPAPRRWSFLAATIVALMVTAAALAGFAGPAAAATNQSALAVPSNEDCLSCHGSSDQKTTTIVVEGQKKSIYVDKSVYDASRHGELACTICHPGFKPGPHDATQTADWLQTAKYKVCRECHADVYKRYASSYHGTLAIKDNSDKAPVCADCHQAHNITPPESTAFRNSIPALCSRCHPDAEKTYLNSYHGKAFYLGREKAAVCSDCHGGHEILPPSNPASTVSKQNRVATCAKCHPGANANFAGFLVHVNPSSPHSSLAVWTINVLYIILISVVFTFGAVHTSLYIYRGIKDGLYSRSHTG